MQTRIRASAGLALALVIAAMGPIAKARGAEGGGTWVDGITEAVNDVTLSASLPGIVGARPVAEGAFVKAGDVILELDKKLEELEAERRKQLRDLRRTDLESTRSLFERKAISISREELDKRTAEAAVAEIEHELAKEQLKRRQMAAPFDGVVSAILLDVGEACQAQQPLARVVDVRRCYFIVNVGARAGYSLRAGQPVRLQIEAGSAPFETTGTIFFIPPVVDPASGLLKVKVVFENPEGKIRPGVAGRMLLEAGTDA